MPNCIELFNNISSTHYSELKSILNKTDTSSYVCGDYIEI